MVWTRGMYGPAAGFTARNELVAFDWRDGQLTQGWRFNAVSNGANSDFVGEGAQSLSVADVDGDGFDEIVYGAAVVDHDGTLLYATRLGHGDALHVSDMVPSRPGLEVFMPHESANTNGNVGASLRDAMTGEIIFASYGEGDVGRGVAADVDPNSLGYEVWSVYDEVLYAADGTVLGTMPFEAQAALYNYAIWWDGDLTRELLNGETIYNYDGPGYSTILRAWQQGAENTNDGKRTPALQADLFGDWREEVIWRTADNTALQVWTTTIPTSHRIYTLMHDSQYREAIAWQNVGYNQPPHPSFFLGAGMDDPPTPLLYFAGELAGDYNRDGVVNAIDYAVWRDAAVTQNLAADGDHNGVVDQDDHQVWRANFGAAAAPATTVSVHLGRGRKQYLKRSRPMPMRRHPSRAPSPTYLCCSGTPKQEADDDPAATDAALAADANDDLLLLSDPGLTRTQIGEPYVETLTSTPTNQPDGYFGRRPRAGEPHVQALEDVLTPPDRTPTFTTPHLNDTEENHAQIDRQDADCAAGCRPRRSILVQVDGDEFAGARAAEAGRGHRWQRTLLAAPSPGRSCGRQGPVGRSPIAGTRSR